jgi:PAS domain S-box-containing protein
MADVSDLQDVSADLLRVDWSATELGPLSGWDLRLRTMVGFVLRSAPPICLFWGPSGTMIFNAAWQYALGPLQSEAFGWQVADLEDLLAATYRDALSSTAANDRPAFATALTPVMWRLLVDRPGASLSCCGVPGEAGQVEGILVQRMSGPASAPNLKNRSVFLLRLGDVLSQQDDPEIVQAIGTQMLGQMLCADRASLAEIDMEAGVAREGMEYRRDAEAPPHETLHRLQKPGPALGLLYKGMPLVISDFAQVDDEPSEAIASEILSYSVAPCRSQLSVPVMRRDSLVAVMTIRFNDPHDWTSDEIAIAHDAATRIWEAMERARAEAAARQSELRLTLAQKAARVATFDWQIGDRSVIWSTEALTMLGLNTGALGGTYEDWIATIHPDDLSYATSQIEWALEDGELEGEWRVRRADGEVIWVLVRGVVDKDYMGRPKRLTGAQVDVTDRVRSEQDTRALIADLSSQIAELRRYLGKDET